LPVLLYVLAANVLPGQSADRVPWLLLG